MGQQARPLGSRVYRQPEGQDRAGGEELLDRIKRDWRLRFAAIAGGVLVLVLTLGIAVLPFTGLLSQQDLEALGYPGVFISNFLATALFFLPLPGLTAAGQGLIATLGDRLDPVVLAVVGGSAMALGELAPYMAGRGLRTLASHREMPVKGRAGRWLQAVAGWVDHLMMRYGIPTLFILSALPNPLFEFAGLTAGATRMRVAKFFIPVAAGKFVRAFLLAFLGQHVLHFFGG